MKIEWWETNEKITLIGNSDDLDEKIARNDSLRTWNPETKKKRKESDAKIEKRRQNQTHIAKDSNLSPDKLSISNLLKSLDFTTDVLDKEV